MKAWEIYTADIHGPHPCVLISCQARIDAKTEIVVLKCTSMKPGQERNPKENETVLDQADGLDWKTLCRCDLMFTVEKSKLNQKRGEVTPERRRDIARKIIQGLAIAGM
jgi:PemK-like, MazF-like toxin of type II toxin-antitoxin system